MEKEQMEAFLAIAKTKSFTRAAELLHVAQSTITTRIKGLEATTGQTLFERDNRHVEVTAAGHVLLPYVQRVLELMNEGVHVTRMQNQFEERLVIGSISSVWHSYLLPKLRTFRRRHPKTALRTITGHSNDIVRDITDGLVDVGVVFVPPQTREFEVIPLYTDSIHLVGTPDFQLLAGATHVTPSDLHRYPYIHVNWGSPFTEWFEEEVGPHQMHALQMDHTMMFTRLLLEGEGIGFLLDSVTQAYRGTGQLRTIPFQSSKPIPQRTTYLIYQKRRHQSPALQKWVRFLQGEEKEK